MAGVIDLGEERERREGNENVITRSMNLIDYDTWNKIFLYKASEMCEQKNYEGALRIIDLVKIRIQNHP
ncbi:hypothetical protein J4427_01605 [Candidatus Woesearchaeota archaeon]|nr:hypothetical protein [Candidatus Woesearchaeota archaeon]